MPKCPTSLWIGQSRATFRSDDLSDTNFLYADLEDTTIALSNLDRLYSGDLNGTPAFLPAHYSVIGGYLIGPGVRLSDLYFTMTDLPGVLFTNASLDRARFVNADLNGGSLHGAELPRTTWLRRPGVGGSTSPSKAARWVASRLLKRGLRACR